MRIELKAEKQSEIEEEETKQKRKKKKDSFYHSLPFYYHFIP